MKPNDQTAPVSKGALWAGRIISGLVILFLLFDSIMKIILIKPVSDSFAQLGYPLDLARPVGIILLVSTILYIFPRTAIFGAILLTGFLGGATDVKFRMEDPWFLFSVGFGILVWAGLYLRDKRVRMLIPFRTDLQ